jgi:hypothetical protein
MEVTGWFSSSRRNKRTFANNVNDHNTIKLDYKLKNIKHGKDIK